MQRKEAPVRPPKACTVKVYLTEEDWLFVFGDKTPLLDVIAHSLYHPLDLEF